MRYTNGLGIAPGDRMTLLQSSTFSGAVSSMFGALLNWRIAVSTGCGALDAERARGVDRAGGDHHLSLGADALQELRAGSHFPSVRVFRLEGDRATHRDVELFRSHFSEQCVLVNGLGATETGLVRRFVIGRDTPVPRGSSRSVIR
jgi:hypothetical protein